MDVVRGIRDVDVAVELKFLQAIPIAAPWEPPFRFQTGSLVTSTMSLT